MSKFNNNFLNLKIKKLLLTLILRNKNLQDKKTTKGKKLIWNYLVSKKFSKRYIKEL